VRLVKNKRVFFDNDEATTANTTVKNAKKKVRNNFSSMKFCLAILRRETNKRNRKSETEKVMIDVYTTHNMLLLL
jgi:hypothetical protein